MSARASESEGREERGAPDRGRWALVLLLVAWCLFVLFVIGAVSIFGAVYPLGRGAVATLVYGLFFDDYYSPHRGKMDLAIGLAHLFILYKAAQWTWRHSRMNGSYASGPAP
jgi:hypothetical protein